jgi:hypothetical protein
MSGLEEQITNINKLIENYTNELNTLRIRSYQNKDPNLIKKQKQLINHINSLTKNLNAIQNYQRQEQRIVQQRITNRNVPSDKDSDEELLKELEEADEEEEKEEKEEEKDDEESGVKPVKENIYTPLINTNPGEIEMVDLYKKEEKTGFSETIVTNKNVSTGPIRPNMEQCPQIFDIGKKVNNNFFIPSQFPNLTKKKSLLKEGRKHMKTQNKNKKVISKKEISKKVISKKKISRNKKKSVKNLAL